MGVRKYQSYRRTLWKVDAWLVRPDGPPIRLRQSKIPTREQAVALEAKLKTDAFEGQFFERHRMATEITAELLTQYEKLGAQENRAWSTESGRAAHLRRHLGQVRASAVTTSSIALSGRSTATGRPITRGGDRLGQRQRVAAAMGIGQCWRQTTRLRRALPLFISQQGNTPRGRPFE